MITITLDLDNLTPLELAALSVIVMDGAPVFARKAACLTIGEAGRANCGDDYADAQKEAEDFLGWVRS